MFKGIWTQGFTGAASSTGVSNVYSWRANSNTKDVSNWTELVNGTNTFSSGKGALVYVYSDDNGPHVAGDAGFSKALNADGFPVSSDLNVSSYLNKSKSGLSLLGNPFITNLDWDLVTAVSNISNSVYVWDNSTSDWKTWKGTAGDLTDGLIGPFNGFLWKQQAFHQA